ncbi:MAG: ATP-grasp domain-containing protein [Thermoanaerobaculia bacterium]|nr:ATP-grasp domain-containing protein [Thermoanaerobaculia bacterium]
MACYLLVDPLGDYAERQKNFLDRLGLDAVAIFSSRVRQAKWQHKWRHRLGAHVIGEFLVEDDVATVAQQIVDAHGADGFFGVVPWDEMHVVLAAELSDRLRLDWNSKDVLLRFRDKYRMKAWLREMSEVRVNKSRVVTSAAEALEFQQKVDRWPLVVKPTTAAGAVGVSFAHGPEQLLRYCQQVMESGLGEVLLEEFIGGREFAVNGLVDRNGDFLATDVWAYDKRASHGIPNLYYQSIKISTGGLFHSLASYAADVVQTLGLRRSPVHMEVKVDDRGPCLIEVGARMAGGDQPVLASKLHGRSLFELAVCHYLDELPLSPEEVSYARYDLLEARIVSGIQSAIVPEVHVLHGYEEVRQLPSFEDFGFFWPPGTSVPVTRDLNTKSYEVYLMHEDALQVEHDARVVRAVLRYE